MEITLADLAGRIGARVDGDERVRVRAVAAIESATATDVVFAEGEAAVQRALASPAAAVIVAEAQAAPGKPLLRCAVPRAAFARALALLHPPARPAPGIHPTAVVGRDVELGPEVSIGAHAVVGDACRLGARVAIGPQCTLGERVHIGPDSRLFPNVTLYDGVELGARVVLHAGCVLGADGYGYVQEGGHHVKIPQVGTVIVEDDVEVGANTTIDRATLGVTRIGRGSKIDNLVQVGHNVALGAGCLLAAQVGISGSSRLGDFVVLGGQVGVGDHVAIGDGVVVGGQGGVLTGKRLSARQVLWGTPARPLAEARRQVAALARLPDLLERVRELARRVQELEGHHRPE